MKETKGIKGVKTLGMNMRYAPEIRPIMLRVEVGPKDHKTISLADDKTGAMLLAVISPDAEKILREALE